jgi:hypothetical protein
MGGRQSEFDGRRGVWSIGFVWVMSPGGGACIYDMSKCRSLLRWHAWCRVAVLNR